MFRNYAPLREEKVNLTDREREILTMMTRGHSYKMIASECQLSIDTVRFHIKKIYEKLQVHSMTEAVSKALKNKWVSSLRI
jgi:DNA-binding NarL/FixJ family response regulator